MFTGFSPFQSNSSRDCYYKHISSNNHDTFWETHSKNLKGKKYFSEEFIDLLNGMFSQEPTERLSFSDLKSHPWYKGKVASQLEI